MSGIVALVTGGTRGIGLATARALADRGCDLVLCGVRAAAAVADVVDQFVAGGRQVLYVAADIARAADREALVDRALDRFGRIDVLVNNAGRAPNVRADLLDATEASFEDVLGVNLRGPYFLTQRVARCMLETPAATPQRRAIVFVTWVSAVAASPNRGEYCVSKAGLSMAVKLFATRLAPHDIPVFEVRPGIIDTDMTAGVHDQYSQRIAGGLVPAGRWGTGVDVGRAVAALACGDLTFSTGSVLHVDGGLHVPRL